MKVASFLIMVSYCFELFDFFFRLSADENATPENPAIRKSLSSMLTPYIAKQFSNDSPKEVCAEISLRGNKDQ